MLVMGIELARCNAWKTKIIIKTEQKNCLQYRCNQCVWHTSEAIQPPTPHENYKQLMRTCIYIPLSFRVGEHMFPPL